jgi:hypothetical protein
MAGKTIAIGDYVKYSPDRGNENPNGRTIMHGTVTKVNDDGTYNLLLNTGKVKEFVSDGDYLGTFRVVAKPKTKKDIPSDENDPYRLETETTDLG